MLKLSASASTRSIELPAELADQLQAEARRNRKSLVAYLQEQIEDQIDGREAAKRLKSLRSGKTKAIPAEQVYADLGI